MTDCFISSVHVQKLGHALQEIRVRALLNIVSKLENGFVYDNDLARSREILQRLFQWFEFEDCSHEDQVLNLIKRILTSDSGSTLIKYYGLQTIREEIQQVRTRVDTRLYPKVNELLAITENYAESQVNVPPLRSDVPLSYRSGDEELPPRVDVEPTATTMTGSVHQKSSLEQQTGAPDFGVDGYLLSLERETYGDFCLKWQPLIVSDRHVLESVEQALKNPSEPSTLLHSCEFFLDVMLQDFPAEVFLQRPAIILLFLDYVRSSLSTRLTTSIFSCFLKLTKCLKTRVHYYSDASTYCLKENVFNDCNTAYYASLMSNRNASAFKMQQTAGITENTELLKSKQLLLPQYCFMTMTTVFEFVSVKPTNLRTHSAPRKSNAQNAVNVALALLDELISLLSLILTSTSWDDSNDPDIVAILHLFENVLTKFAQAVDHFRLEVASDESNVSSRISFLRLLCSCSTLLTNLIPIDAANHILPKSMKNVLSDSLLDPSLARLYPGTHETIHQFVKEFGGRFESDSVSKYQEVNKVCSSITSALKMFRSSSSLPLTDALQLAKEAVDCLEIHKNISFVSVVISLCADNLSTCSKDETFDIVEDIIGRLLGHGQLKISEETYRQCEKRVVAAIGPKQNTSKTGAPGSQIVFLLRPSILMEITLHGLNSTSKQIKNWANNILVHVLKCKILVIDDIWNRAVEAIISILPLLACVANKVTALGRTIIGFLDPDSGKSLLVPPIQILKGNLCMLFVNDNITRDEALSRLLWMLTSQKNSRDLLPRLNSLHDKSLSALFQLQRTINLNKERTSQQFYQSSALYQVLEMLQSPNIEPTIRRSALTQVSVMVEDPRLHYTFLELDGVQIVLSVMESALNEHDYKDYVDCIIPAIVILKNLCLHSSGVRLDLSNNFEALCNILRGLLVFCSEERVRQDANILLCLLVFHPFVLGSASSMDLSLPYLVTEQLLIPFTCNVHWRSSKHTSSDLRATLMDDRWCKRSIQIHWNSEWFGGFSQLLKRNEIHYSKENMSNFDSSLHLSNSDLETLKSSSLHYGVGKCLVDIQNGTSHNNTIDNIWKLESYVQLLLQSKSDEVQKDVLKHPWEASFYRFLNAPPSSQDDMLLLTSILKFLGKLVPLYSAQGETCWVVVALRSSTHVLPNLLQVESAPDFDIKLVHQELLNLITVCVLDQQHYMDLRSHESTESLVCEWLHVINIVADNLKLSESQHFYNLSYLDCTMSCLVHLTSSLGWSSCKKGQLPPEPIPNLINGLCELISAFHCGKGSSAADSLMGLSITRHITLILNHLVMEMHFNGAKGWEQCFLSDKMIEENILYSICSLWISRDTILRASVLQLLSGLAVSPKTALELIQEDKDLRSGSNFWESMIAILLDNAEASIVRENAANVLFNLLSHYQSADGQFVTKQRKKDVILFILNVLDESKFYTELDTILGCLVEKPVINISNINSNSAPSSCRSRDKSEKNFAYSGIDSLRGSRRSARRTCCKMVVTPSLVKNITQFVHNLIMLAEKRVIQNLQEHGVIKVLFRCLLRPYTDVRNSKDLAFYCDVLEMNTAICVVLSKTVSSNTLCLNTVLHTRDCINILLSLLNPNVYYVDLPHLVYLRNKLWTEIFILIGSLLEGSSAKVNALSIVTYALNECGYEPFLQTLCESISSISSFDLQHSALASLTSLLRAETDGNGESSDEDKILSTSPSMKMILDSIETPRTPYLEDLNSEPELEVLWVRKPQRFSENPSSNKFESIYFNAISNNLHVANNARSKSEEFETKKNKKNRDNSPKAGAQLCKILLHLYDVSILKDKDRKRATIVCTLTSILAVSEEAKKIALQNGLVEMFMRQLREIHAKLSLESVACLRRLADKKRICPVMKDLGGLVGLITNFMLGDENVKGAASTLGFADVLHKLWVWFCVDRSLLADMLKMLCTYTTDCYLANQCLPLTSSLLGTGPRKALSNLSLLHEIVTLIGKEMDMISPSHDLTILELLFHVLHNSCTVVECRNVLIKTALLQSLSRLHPAITKKQKARDTVELIWLEFLITLTGHNEGQMNLAKNADALEIVMMLASSAKTSIRYAAMLVLRNVSFLQSNRARLINSPDFVKILLSKLSNGNTKERNVTVTIIWALIANNQRAKLMLKCAGLDLKLQDLIKGMSLSSEQDVNQDSLEMIYSVLGILKEGEKVK